MEEISLSQIDGFYVGQASNRAAGTGCTVILTPAGAVASSFNPGFAPGSRETDLLKPENTVDKVHGLLLAGGSAFGLAAAEGVVRFLREQGYGLDTGHVRVPLVPAAVIYDYPGNQSLGTLPDAALGYLAAMSAGSDPVYSGPYGAGLSATSGKAAGPARASRSGLGSFGYRVRWPLGGGQEAEYEGRERLPDLRLAALCVVNPFGSIIEPRDGRVVSGLRREDGSLADRDEILKIIGESNFKLAGRYPDNTVLVAVGTNARLDKLGAHRLARMASAGLSRAVYPSNLAYDGDTVFVLSSNDGPEVDENYLGALSAEVVARAIVNSALYFENRHV